MNINNTTDHYPPAWRTFQTVIITIITLLILLGNMSNIIILPRITLYGSSITQFYLMSLAVADFGVGLLVTPFSIATSITNSWVYSNFWCEVTAISVAMLCATSIYSIAALCIDRYLHLTYPLHYETVVTKRRCFMIIISIWLLSATMFLIHKIMWGQYYYDDLSYICTIDFPKQWKFTTFIICIVVVPSTTAIIFTNYKIVQIALKHVKQINNIPRTSPQNIPSPSNENDLECPTQLALTLTLQANKWKSIKVNFIIAATFFVSWIPYSLLQVFLALGYHDVPQPLVFVIQWIALGNSFWNSLIYFFMNSQYRQNAKDLFVRLVLRRKNSIHPEPYDVPAVQDFPVAIRPVTASSNSDVF